MKRKHFTVILCFVASVWACSKADADNLHTAPFKGFEQPLHFPEPAYKLANNPINKEGFELGRKLFYDPLLSANNTISCGSCHIQTSSFTQHGHSVSHGIFDRVGTRNSTPLVNLAWATTFMWDGGVFDLDLQPIVPITNHVEMGDSLANVLAKLRSHSVYPTLFKKAFGSDEITTAHLMKALSQFMVMCVSSNAKYDSVVRRLANFTPAEDAGYALVKQKCGACHAEPLFTDFSFRNNGLSISTINDIGRGAITLHEEDKYKFKTPSLRNLAYTAPYMHDGRFYTLDAVLDHYDNGVQATPNLDPLLQQNNSLGIGLTAEERSNILAFLNTLNDRSFVLDNRFAEQ